MSAPESKAQDYPNLFLSISYYFFLIYFLNSQVTMVNICLYIRLNFRVK